MSKMSAAIAAVALLSAGAASAQSLTKGDYTSIGIVASNNGAATCASVGLSVNASVTSVVTYPGAGAKGFTIYTPPFGGGLQLCSAFPAVPAGGLDGFSAAAKCGIYTINGDVPAQKVNFSFTSTVTDSNSAIGTTTVTIPSTDTVGAGCSAVINTTIIRVG